MYLSSCSVEDKNLLIRSSNSEFTMEETCKNRNFQIFILWNQLQWMEEFITGMKAKDYLEELH